MFGLRKPAPTVTITEERFNQLIEIARASEDLLAVLGDLTQGNAPKGGKMLELKVVEGYPAALVKTSIEELKQAIIAAKSETT